MQDMDNMHHEEDFDRTSPSILVFLASLPFRRTGPILASLLALFILTPFLYLVFFAPSLFVTDPTMEVLSVWLDARAIIAEPPSLATMSEALREGSFLYMMLLNTATELGATPGQSILMAQGAMVVLLLLPLSYGAAMRMPLLPALLLTAFILSAILVPVAGILSGQAAISMAVFLWMSLITYARPYRSMQRCAQLEGVLAGFGLWFLYMTAMPLFLAAFVGFLAALVLQLRRGLVFATMAVGVFMLIGASTELFSYLMLGEGLVLFRLADLTGGYTAAPWGVQHWLALAALPLSLLIHEKQSIVQAFCLSALLVVGSIGLIANGQDVLPLLALAAFLALFARAGQPMERITIHTPREALTGLLAIAFVPVFIAGLDIARTGTGLLAQFQRTPLTQTAEMGFSFADQPKLADLVIGRKIDPMVANDFEFTPADQAVLMKEGLKVVNHLLSEKKPVAFVSAGNLTSLYDISVIEVGAAHMVVTPKLSIDSLTDQARVTNQGVLYADYKRVQRQEQISPVYDIWVKR